jgi:benzoylformate decarboxylase
MAEMRAVDALFDIMRREGVEYIFGIPGATEIPFMDALEDVKEIKYILCPHETAAVGIAEGYARTSGRVGVVNLHTGAGLAASLPMLSNAYYGGVPLLVTAGQQDTRLLAREPSLADDLVRIAGPFTRWGMEIIHGADVPVATRRAFRAAAHPPAGPVFLSLPVDILSEKIEYEYIPGSPALAGLHPDGRAIEKAAGLLAGARSPVMIVEDGIAKSGALAGVVRLAEQTGARVYQPWMADVNFPVDHPLYLYDIDVNSPETRQILEKADVLVVAGARFFSQAIYQPGSLVPPGLKIVQLDSDPWQIGKNYPVDCGVEGDIRVALADLAEAIEKRLTARQREAAAARGRAIAGEKQAMQHAFEAKVRAEWNNVPISGTRFMRELRDAIRPGTRVVEDCWSYSSILRRAIPFSEPLSYQRSRGGGSIGWGLPGAIGVKLASLDRAVVCVSGDGSALWSVQSLWTAARYEIPVTFIVLANGCYRQVRVMKLLMMGEGARGRDLGTDLCPPSVDFVRVAEAMGLAAARVEEPDRLRDELGKALAMDRPNLLEVVVDARI